MSSYDETEKTEGQKDETDRACHLDLVCGAVYGSANTDAGSLICARR